MLPYPQAASDSKISNRRNCIQSLVERNQLINQVLFSKTYGFLDKYIFDDFVYVKFNESVGYIYL